MQMVNKDIKKKIQKINIIMYSKLFWTVLWQITTIAFLPFDYEKFTNWCCNHVAFTMPKCHNSSNFIHHFHGNPSKYKASTCAIWRLYWVDQGWLWICHRLPTWLNPGGNCATVKWSLQQKNQKVALCNNESTWSEEWSPQ